MPRSAPAAAGPPGLPLTSEELGFTLLSELKRTLMNKMQLLQGTLDLLILRILELGPNHGWGISNRLQQITKDGLKTSQGSLYPALHRLELRGEVRSEMTASENNRRARVYTITPAGRKRLNQETETWEEFALSMRRILREGR